MTTTQPSRTRVRRIISGVVLAASVAMFCVSMTGWGDNVVNKVLGTLTIFWPIPALFFVSLVSLFVADRPRLHTILIGAIAVAFIVLIGTLGLLLACMGC